MDEQELMSAKNAAHYSFSKVAREQLDCRITHRRSGLCRLAALLQQDLQQPILLLRKPAKHASATRPSRKRTAGLPAGYHVNCHKYELSTVCLYASQATGVQKHSEGTQRQLLCCC
jgi:hypothetical protein